MITVSGAVLVSLTVFCLSLPSYSAMRFLARFSLPTVKYVDSHIVCKVGLCNGFILLLLSGSFRIPMYVIYCGEYLETKL